jgi:hypothetical protein
MQTVRSNSALKFWSDGSETTEATLSDATAAAIQVAADAETTAAAATASAEAAIVAAEAHVEAAEEVRDLIAEAALRDAISDRVDDIEERCEAWHGEHGNLIGQLTATVAEQAMTIASLTSRLVELETRPVPSSTLPTLPEIPAATITEVTTTTVNPVGAESAPMPEGLGSGKKVRRFL